MSENKKSDARPTTEVEVNWEGLKRFMGWEGSINDLKKVVLDRRGNDQPTVEARRSKQ